MTDKVQKIREEVERIQLYTQSEVLKQVLDYIDEVQKEPVSDTQSPVVFYGLTGSVGSTKEEPISEDLEKAADKFVKSYIKGGTKQSWLKEGYMAGAKWGENQVKVEIQAQSMALAHGCPKESVSEDLGEAANQFATQNEQKYEGSRGEDCSDYDTLVFAFKGGAHWRDAQIPKLLGDVDDVAEKMALQVYPKKYEDDPDGDGYLPIDINEDERAGFEDGFIAGAQWKEQQMMAKFVEWLEDNFRTSPFDNTKVITNFSSMADVIRNCRKAMSDDNYGKDNENK